MRIKGLDLLRGIAVILVLFRHGSSFVNILSDIGWMGVDLFFVLSGFLVSGIVFKEYINNKKVNVKRFLIRRGLKIYPSFYIFIAVSIVAHFIFKGGNYKIHQIINEIFYLQNYGEGMWFHTWSLAVEEHFYIGLAVFIFFAIKTNMIEKRNYVIAFFIAIYITSLLMRIFALNDLHHDERFLTYTHIRIDGIIIGVLLSYIYYFTTGYKIFLKHRNLFLGISILLVSPLLILKGQGPYIYYVLSLINIGFGLMVFYALGISSSKLPFLIDIPFSALSFIGIHSYSIYLWHILVLMLVSLVEFNNLYIEMFVAIVLPIIVGIVLSYLIEKPFLMIRETVFK
jgi:peptidoglycan/LPS O-acetylase OafA/YrhL